MKKLFAARIILGASLLYHENLVTHIGRSELFQVRLNSVIQAGFMYLIE